MPGDFRKDTGADKMNANLPKDPMILLSVVNTKLRDHYASLDALCSDIGAEKERIIEALRGIDYEYDESGNQFI